MNLPAATLLQALADIDALVAAGGTPAGLKLRGQYWQKMLARGNRAGLLATLRADVANGALTVAERIEALDRAGLLLLSEVL